MIRISNRYYSNNGAPEEALNISIQSHYTMPNGVTYTTPIYGTVSGAETVDCTIYHPTYLNGATHPEHNKYYEYIDYMQSISINYKGGYPAILMLYERGGNNCL